MISLVISSQVIIFSLTVSMLEFISYISFMNNRLHILFTEFLLYFFPWLLNYISLLPVFVSLFLLYLEDIISAQACLLYNSTKLNPFEDNSGCDCQFLLDVIL